MIVSIVRIQVGDKCLGAGEALAFTCSNLCHRLACGGIRTFHPRRAIRRSSTMRNINNRDSI